MAHQEIRRRERVIRIFPNEASALRLSGAPLAEQHEEWPTGRRYLDTTLLEQMEQEEAGETTKEVTRLVSTV